jgi:hypothetical protein
MVAADGPLASIAREDAELFLVESHPSRAAVDEVVRAADGDTSSVAELQRRERALIAFAADDAAFESGSAVRVHAPRMKYAPRHGQLCGERPARPTHFGVGIAQKPAIQRIPLVAVPQQSDDAVHFSSTFEQPTGGGTHANDDPPSSGTWRQKPLQQSVPDWHDAPFPSHGGSVQKPRMLPAPSSCPGR